MQPRSKILTLGKLPLFKRFCEQKPPHSGRGGREFESRRPDQYQNRRGETGMQTPPPGSLRRGSNPFDRPRASASKKPSAARPSCGARRSRDHLAGPTNIKTGEGRPECGMGGRPLAEPRPGSIVRFSAARGLSLSAGWPSDRAHGTSGRQTLQKRDAGQ